MAQELLSVKGSLEWPYKFLELQFPLGTPALAFLAYRTHFFRVALP